MLNFVTILLERESMCWNVYALGLDRTEMLKLLGPRLNVNRDVEIVTKKVES